MSNKTRRAGAIALAATLFAVLFALDGSGANAQSEAMVPLIAAENTSEQAADPVSTIRFVASEVVQDVPDEAAAPTNTDLSHDDFATLTSLVANTQAGGEMGAELKCLAQAVYFESRGEPLLGQLAVARVIVNRSASPLFPDDYCSVVTQPSQFSFIRGGHIPAANERSDAWARATQIARIAHQDLWPSAVKDALYFHAERVRPRWANRKTARATIDSHIFYR